MTLPAAAVFHRGGGFGERFAGAGLTQRALHGRVVNPTGKGIIFFLKCLQVSFHLCDTTGDFFGAAAEVHPAQLIQLCLQMVYFAFTLVQLFQQGTVQRLLFGKETFQCIDIVRK